MNKQRILDLAVAIEDTDEKANAFDMDIWLDMDNPDRFQSIKDTNDLDEVAGVADACGVRACIAGHAVILFDKSGIWQEQFRNRVPDHPKPSIADLAAQLLDITAEQADILFTPKEGTDPKREIPPGYQITARDVADTLWRMTRTDEVQWLIERCLCCAAAAATGDCRCTVGECDCCRAEPDASINCNAGPDCDCAQQKDR